MKVGLAFRDVLSRWPYLVEELDRWAARINAVWNVEHNADGTHKTITSLTAVGAALTTLTVGDGTSAAPSVAFASESDTGLSLTTDVGPGVAISARGIPVVKVHATGAPTLMLPDVANGTSATGPILTVGHNTSGSGSAGVLALDGLDGTTYYLWVDAAGKLRIHGSPPNEAGGDTDGTIVGTQS